MAHEILEHDTMAYVGEVPWHGLGRPVHAGVSVDRMAIEAGLEWEVGLSPVLFQRNNKVFRDNKHNVMYRDDMGMVLDIVGPNYVPVQNMEVLEFFREYVETGEMELQTAGSLQNGRVIWALAKMHQDFVLRAGKNEMGDKVEGHVLLMNPHQYGKGMVIKFTPIRVVCMNTLTMALAGGGGLKLWHNRKFDTAAQKEAKLRLGIARERMEAFREDSEKLAQMVLDEAVVINLLNEVFGSDKVDQPLEEQSPTVQRVMALYNGEGMGANLTTAKSTAWGLLGAVTEYHDHHYGKTADSRMSAAWMGMGETRKRRMLESLLALHG